MILEEETYEKFGYYPSDLAPQSHKLILVSCNECGKIQEITKGGYYGTSLCRSCSHLGKRNPNFGKHWHLSEKAKANLCKVRNRDKKSKYPLLNNKRWLYHKYWIEKLTTYEIGAIVGCAHCIVWNALKRQNIQVRTNSEIKKGNKYWLGKHHTEKTKKKIGDMRRILTPVQRKLNIAIASNIRHSLKGTKKGRHWETLVGYTLAELMQTLEKEFRPGMTWKNHGSWHIDHIIPLARFSFESSDDPEFKKAWALKNLQPLWAGENIRKSDNFLFF